MSFTIKQFDGTSTNYLTSGKGFGKKTLSAMFPNCTIYEQGVEYPVTNQQPNEGKIYFLIKAVFEEEDEPITETFDDNYVDCSNGKHGYDSIEEQLTYAALAAERLYNEVYCNEFDLEDRCDY